jgi:hypothetical protein
VEVKRKNPRTGTRTIVPKVGMVLTPAMGAKAVRATGPAGSAKPITPIRQKSKGKGKPAAKASNSDTKTKADSSENKKKLGDASATTGPEE